MRNYFFITILLLSISACSHVISRVNLERADKLISAAQVMKEPNRYKGKVIILGGEIIKVVNKKDGTYLEILQKKLDSLGRPAQSDETLGRFIVFHEAYLDQAIFAKGRLLTVAGEVMGQKKQPMGEIEYNYLIIKGLELHLTDRRQGPAVRFGIGIGGTF